MLKLEGQCNQCGLCCFAGDLKCLNLEVTGTPGEPQATRCTVYHKRFKGMPILLVNKDGVVESLGCCSYDNEEIENEAILERGIGKGCSLRVVEG